MTTTMKTMQFNLVKKINKNPGIYFKISYHNKMVLSLNKTEIIFIFAFVFITYPKPKYVIDKSVARKLPLVCYTV